MPLNRIDRRVATFIRLAGVVLIGFSVLQAEHRPGGHGRGVNHGFAKTSARDRAQAVHYPYTHGLAG